MQVIESYKPVNKSYQPCTITFPKRDKGTHWVAICFDFNSGVAEYFDPLGKGSRNTVSTVLTDAGIIINDMHMQTQINNGNDCGIWCCWYGDLKIRGFSGEEIHQKYLDSKDNKKIKKGKIRPISPDDIRDSITTTIKNYAYQYETLEVEKVGKRRIPIADNTMIPFEGFGDESGNNVYEELLQPEDNRFQHYWSSPGYVREAVLNQDKWLNDVQIISFLEAVNRNNNGVPVSILPPLADFMVQEWFNNFLINEDPKMNLENKRLIVLNLA